MSSVFSHECGHAYGWLIDHAMQGFTMKVVDVNRTCKVTKVITLAMSRKF
jgi:hypothetical protein